jgi:tyrosyl-tRNA synthetase
MPLLEGTDGVRKMSKSAGNYIALEDKPGEMFGEVLSISDAVMYRYYELLTTEELAPVRALHPRAAKQSLAELIIARYHGAEAGSLARTEFQQKFQEREFPDEPDVRLALADEDLRDGQTIGLINFVAKTNLVPSKSEVRQADHPRRRGSRWRKAERRRAHPDDSCRKALSTQDRPAQIRHRRTTRFAGVVSKRIGRSKISCSASCAPSRCLRPH